MSEQSPPSPPPSGSSSSPSPSPPSPSQSQSPPPKSSPPPPSSSSSLPPPQSSSSSSSSPPPPSPNGDNNNKSPPPPSKSNGNDDSSPPPPPPPPPRPPPPRSGRSPSGSNTPPPPPISSSSSDSSSSSSSTNEKAVIAGVAAGAGLLLLMMIVFLISCGKRKKRKPHDQMHYYRDDSRGGGSDYYSGQHGNWQNHHPQMGNNDHVLKMPQSTNVSSEHGWPIAPPPPPPPMSSSDMSSAAYSGPHNPPLPPPHPAVALGFTQSSFSYDDLAAATGGFAHGNLLGQGGFGYVHKGVLPNGKEIAVKSLKANSGQGEREFQAEVDIISRVHHRHLVSLVGYCIAGSQRMLVYEFVPNNTLEYHLHGSGRPVMDWSSRLKIALGSAKGFAYLHEDCHPRIIHRDIKAANILLDLNFEAKVADFGLAKLSSDTHTHVSTRIMGTFGYLAPEYASSGKLTEKSDVYSYGVMLLELITGRRPVDVSSDDDSLVDWARPILGQVVDGGSFEELVDPKLEDRYDPMEVMRMVACAAASIRHSARRRPKMSQIVRALEGDVSLEDLHEGVKPGHSALFGSSSSSEYDSSYHTDLKKFMKKTGLSSQEFTSGEHGMTGEYLHSSGGESQEIHPRTRSRSHTP